MKDSVLFLAVGLGAVAVLEGCRVSVGTTGGDGDLTSAMRSGESIAEAADKIGVAAQVGSSGQSVHHGRHKCDLQVDVVASPEQFAAFMAEVRKGVCAAIDGAGGKIHGQGRSGSEDAVTDFSFSYERGTRAGFVEVFSSNQGPEDYLLTLLAYEHD